MTTPAATATEPSAHQRLSQARWALLFGNFAIGCGVMVVAGSLNDLTRSLQVSVALGGQLISLAALTMCLGAPLLAALIGGWDRRRLLALSLAWFALGHLLSALAPNYATLLPLRALCVVAAAVFTPQAAAAIGAFAPPEERGRAIIFIFLGWSVSSVIGMPVHSFVGEAFGWRWAFALVALLSAGAAWWVWQAMPDGIRPPAMRLAAWREVFTHPVLMAIIAVTAMTSAGQFTLFAYFAPYYRQVLGADAVETSLLFCWFGSFGLLGNLVLGRVVDRTGPAQAMVVVLLMVGASMLVWPLATSVVWMAIVLVPWALACFASNSAQQARLGLAAPELAPALMALNSSAIYLGQAIGAAGGGALVAAGEALGHAPRALYGGLHWVGLAWTIAALALSVWAHRRMTPRA